MWIVILWNKSTDVIIISWTEDAGLFSLFMVELFSYFELDYNVME